MNNQKNNLSTRIIITLDNQINGLVWFPIRCGTEQVQCDRPRNSGSASRISPRSLHNDSSTIREVGNGGRANAAALIRRSTRLLTYLSIRSTWREARGSLLLWLMSEDSISKREDTDRGGVTEFPRKIILELCVNLLPLPEGRGLMKMRKELKNIQTHCDPMCLCWRYKSRSDIRQGQWRHNPK